MEWTNRVLSIVHFVYKRVLRDPSTSACWVASSSLGAHQIQLNLREQITKPNCVFFKVCLTESLPFTGAFEIRPWASERH